MALLEMVEKFYLLQNMMMEMKVKRETSKTSYDSGSYDFCSLYLYLHKKKLTSDLNFEQ
jgi:hypothetical protein